jgi:hypothetical protein
VPSNSPPPAGSGSGFGGTLKAKWGPLPVWGWLAIVTILGLAYYLYAQHKAGTTTSSASGAAQVPEIVNQFQMPGTTPPDEPKHKKKKDPDEEQDKDKHKDDDDADDPDKKKRHHTSPDRRPDRDRKPDRDRHHRPHPATRH